MLLMAFSDFFSPSSLATWGTGILGATLGYFANEHTNEANADIQDDVNESNERIARETNEANRKMQEAANAMNYRIASETNRQNYDIAQQNLGFQRENLDYQKALQQQIFAREDNAISRTVQGAKDAGVSPLAVLGNNLGAGEVVGTTALNNQYQAQQAAPAQAAEARNGFAQAARMSPYDFSGVANGMMQSFTQLASTLYDFKARQDANDINREKVNDEKLERAERIRKMLAETNSVVDKMHRDRESHKSQLAIDRLERSRLSLANQYQSMLNEYNRTHEDNFSNNRLADGVLDFVKSITGSERGGTAGDLAAGLVTNLVEGLTAPDPHSLPPVTGTARKNAKAFNRAVSKGDDTPFNEFLDNLEVPDTTGYLPGVAYSERQKAYKSALKSLRKLKVYRSNPKPVQDSMENQLRTKFGI